MPTTEWITDDKLRHIFVEIKLGRGQHGSFLTAFAAAYVNADPMNAYILREAAEKIVTKYNLEKYLDNLGKKE